MEEDEMTGVRSSVEKIVQLLNPANLATLVLHGISALLVGIIQVVILGIGVVIVKLLVILGPFVFAVSMLPVFQKQLSIWFGTLCSACMVFTVINILNQIMWQTFKAIYTESADMVDAATQQIQYLGMDLALIGAYCSCFWLSSKIVGHSDAGKIISKTVSIVTTAATIALMGGAAAGGKLTNVGGAASIRASFINDNNKNRTMNLMKFKGADDAVKADYPAFSRVLHHPDYRFCQQYHLPYQQNRKSIRPGSRHRQAGEKSMRQAACLPAICGNTNT